MTQIVWLQAALEDLRGIHGYIARDIEILAIVHTSRLWPDTLP